VTTYIAVWTPFWLAMAGGLIAVGILVGRAGNIGELVVFNQTLGYNLWIGTADPANTTTSFNIRTGTSLLGICAAQNFPAYYYFTCSFGGSVKWDLANTNTGFTLIDAIPEAMVPSAMLELQWLMPYGVGTSTSLAPRLINIKFGTSAILATGPHPPGRNIIWNNDDPSGDNALGDWEVQAYQFNYIKLK
jgi:hypothetical protein